jgi:hypothetical protein
MKSLAAQQREAIRILVECAKETGHGMSLSPSICLQMAQMFLNDSISLPSVRACNAASALYAAAKCLAPEKDPRKAEREAAAEIQKIARIILLEAPYNAISQFKSAAPLATEDKIERAAAKRGAKAVMHILWALSMTADVFKSNRENLPTTLTTLFTNELRTYVAALCDTEANANRWEDRFKSTANRHAARQRVADLVEAEALKLGRLRAAA